METPFDHLVKPKAEENFTSAQAAAYQHYLDALSWFQTMIGMPDIVASQRMAAAKVLADAHNDMMEAFGAKHVRSAADAERIEALQAKIIDLEEAATSAHAMLWGADRGEGFDSLPSDPDLHDAYNVGLRLVSDAQDVLFKALKTAGVI